MYKILIVDDKTLIRTAIKKMIRWDAMPITYAGEASNGQEALDFIDEQDVDIVITDIRMPLINGIELLEQLNQKPKVIQTIIVSGYDEFEYAKAALKNGVLDYILKPIDQNELNHILMKAVKTLNENQQTEIVGDKVLISLIKQELSNFGSDILFSLDDVSHLRLNELKMFFIYMYQVESKYELKVFCQTINEHHRYFNGVLFEHMGDTILVFYTFAQVSTSVLETHVVKAIKSHQHLFSNYERMIFSIGDLITCYDDIKKSFYEAKRNSVYGLIDQNIILSHDAKQKKSYLIDFDEFKKEILLDVTAGNIYGVEKKTHAIIQKYLSLENIDIFTIKLLFTDLCYLVLKTDHEIDQKAHLLMQNINNQITLLSYKSIDALENQVLSLLLECTEMYKKKKEKQTISSMIKNYIDKNYASNIGLSQISTYFYMNASYLSKQFKDETGKNINKYISERRIEHAKEMIAFDPNINLQKLPFHVGFSDYTYFHKVFKKMVGVTPKQYKDKIMYEHNKEQKN